MQNKRDEQTFKTLIDALRLAINESSGLQSKTPIKVLAPAISDYT